MESALGMPGTRAWLAALGGLALLVGLTVVGPGSSLAWSSPRTLFAFVVGAAATCVLTAVAVIVVAARDRAAEVGLLGGALVALSVLPLAHGIAIPGVVYGENHAVTSTSFLALPLAVVVAWPLLAPLSAPARAVARRWRAWVAAWMVAVCVLAGVMLAWPDLIATPGPRAASTLVVVGLSMAALVLLSARQLRLYWIGESRASLLAAIALLSIAASGLVWVGERPYSLGFWLVHGLDVAGALGVFAAVALGHRARRRVTDVLAPVLDRDPLVALEFGLSPVVHHFVAALERKDPITRDHVLRVGELALEVGERLRLPARRLRFLGLAAILHDIGKLAVDDAILNKPDRLTAAEYEQLKRHTIDGERLLREAQGLERAAPLVRHHHERVDGTGYPDGLAGEEIPLEARIIAACDGFDAMAHTRQYREGMGRDRATGILQEHAGTQWDAGVVGALVAVAAAEPSALPRLDGVGRERHALACGCADALPPAALAALRSTV